MSEVRPLPLPKGKLAAWGRKAVQLERVWDGSLRDLYSVNFVQARGWMTANLSTDMCLSIHVYRRRNF